MLTEGKGDAPSLLLFRLFIDILRKNMSTVSVRTEKELGQALKEEKDTIEIEGDLKEKVIKIKATGKVAWAVALGAIAVAVVATLAIVPTRGASAPATCGILPAAKAFGGGIGGFSVACTAVSIAVAAGGVGALKTLREYDLSEKDGVVTLKRSKGK